jgi:hypothetical protein
VTFAAVLTGPFNSRLGLLGEQWAITIANIAQKKAYLNSPETKIKDNIRKRHERVSFESESQSKVILNNNCRC